MALSKSTDLKAKSERVNVIFKAQLTATTRCNKNAGAEQPPMEGEVPTRPPGERGISRHDMVEILSLGKRQDEKTRCQDWGVGGLIKSQSDVEAVPIVLEEDVSVAVND